MVTNTASGEWVTENVFEVQRTKTASKEKRPTLHQGRLVNSFNEMQVVVPLQLEVGQVPGKLCWFMFALSGLKKFITNKGVLQCMVLSWVQATCTKVSSIVYTAESKLLVVCCAKFKSAKFMVRSWQQIQRTVDHWRFLHSKLYLTFHCWLFLFVSFHLECNEVTTSFLSSAKLFMS